MIVHKFVTKGTIEERIEDVLQRKSKLSDSMLTSGESALSGMSVESLRELFTLKDWEESR